MSAIRNLVCAIALGLCVPLSGQLLVLSGARGGGLSGGDPSGGDAPALVGLKVKDQSGIAVSSENVNITGVTAGNAVIVLFAVSAGDCALSASSGTLNVAEDVYSTDWDVSLAIWSDPNASAGSHTITLTPCQQEFIRYAVFEFSGLAASNHVIDTGVGGGLTSTVLVNNVTTAQSNTLLLGAVRTDGDETAHGEIFFGPSFTLIYPFANQEPEQKLLAEYRVVDAGTYGGTLFTMEAGDAYTSALVAYAPE